MGGIDLRDRSVIELGAGTGLLGIVVTLLGKDFFLVSFNHNCSKTSYVYMPGIEVSTKAACINCDGSSLSHLPSLLDLRACWDICCSDGATAVYFMAGPCWGWACCHGRQLSSIQLCSYSPREQELCFPSSTYPPMQIKLHTETTLWGCISLSLACLADSAWRNEAICCWSVCGWRAGTGCYVKFVLSFPG